MDVRISVEAEKARALLERLGRLVGNFKPVLSQVMVAMETQVRNAFRTETDPWGVPWAQLSPLTIAARQARGNFSVQKLVDTRRLFQSIKKTADNGQASISLGDGLPDDRGVYNQYGVRGAGRGRNVTIPARAFVPLRPGGRPDPAPAWWSAVLKPLNEALSRAVQ